MSDLSKLNIDFDIKSFILEKYKVFEKYDDIKDFDIRKRDFINKLDRYLFHCIEEISEAKYELSKLEVNLSEKRDIDFSEFEGEYIDIINYLGTILSILVNCNRDMCSIDMFNEYISNGVDIDSLKNFSLNETYNINSVLRVNFINNSKSYQINYQINFLIRLTDFILNDIISIRRLYPERKWHKNMSVDDDERNTLRLTKSIEKVSKLIYLMMSNFFPYVNDKNFEDNYKSVMDKHNYVMSL